MNDRLDTSSSPDVFDIFAALHAFERRRHGRLVDDGCSVTKAAKQAGVGRSTVYKEMARRRSLPRSPDGGV